MTGTWTAAHYLERELRWRRTAEALPPGDERDDCTSLADQYARVAALIESSNNAWRDERELID